MRLKPKLAYNRPAFAASERAELAESMHHLVHRLGLGVNAKTSRVVAFIAARGGEGTSTVAQGYAEALAVETAQKILVVDASSRFQNGGEHYGIADAMIAGRAAQDAIKPDSQSVSHALWLGNAQHHALATKLLQEGQWQKPLLEIFDAIVIDAPALQYSFQGVLLAASADAAVIVVEAEKTPQPVVENLRSVLFSAGATIAGLVMNKRRYYIPDKIYKRL